MKDCRRLTEPLQGLRVPGKSLLALECRNQPMLTTGNRSKGGEILNLVLRFDLNRRLRKRIYDAAPNEISDAIVGVRIQELYEKSEFLTSPSYS